MNATEEWLRYIENKVMFQRYHINNYSEPEEDEESKDKEEKTKDSDSN